MFLPQRDLVSIIRYCTPFWFQKSLSLSTVQIRSFLLGGDISDLGLNFWFYKLTLSSRHIGMTNSHQIHPPIHME